MNRSKQAKELAERERLRQIRKQKRQQAELRKSQLEDKEDVSPRSAAGHGAKGALEDGYEDGPDSDERDVAEGAFELAGYGQVRRPFKTPRVSGPLKPKPIGFFQRAELWMFCLNCLNHRIRKFQIKRMLKDFIVGLGFEPSMAHPTFERILSRARAEFGADITGLSREDHISDGYHTMLSIITDPTAEPADKIKAQQVINEMIGLTAKYSDGEQSAEDKVKKIKALLDDEDPEDDGE